MNHEVIDVDYHLSEDNQNLIDYFDDPWKTRLQSGGFFSQASFYPSFTGDNRVGGRIQRDKSTESMTTDDILEGMEKIGVDKCLLLSDIILSLQGLQADDDRGSVLANAATDYILDQVIAPKQGIHSAIPIPIRDPPAAIDLIERVEHKNGVAGVYVLAANVEPPLGNKKYEPIYEAAANADLPIIIHSAGSSLDDYHTSGFGKFIETHSLHFMETNLEQITSLTIQGIPEKFPNLEFVFLESGIYWVAAIMERLDAEYMKRQSEAPLLTKKPSKYMKENFYFGTQPIEQPEKDEHLEHIIEMVGGSERLMYASDYPHWDFDHPSTITKIDGLSESDKKQILSDNAKQVFGI